jgi:uncharacterized PurR-regulated membrane protein YhhQ (DUF165 family)
MIKKELKVLLRNIPSLALMIFGISIVLMNLLANKSINFSVDWLALDCGIVVSWLAFMIMDIVTKRFGAKASNTISIIVTIVNLIVCLVLFLVSKIDGSWSESYITGSENVINNALNNTFGGTWYVLLGSTIAFVISAFVNNFSNVAINKIFKKNPNSFKAYILSSYGSSMLGQFVDNLIFSLLVSHFFFEWNLIQCLTSALLTSLVELICQIFFSPIGYKILKCWEKENVGKEYLELKKGIVE